MSENKRKYTPITGDRLKRAAEEARDPQFFQRLAGSIYAEADKRGLLRSKLLPGMKTCDDLAMDIVTAVLAGRRKWLPDQSFYHACGSAIRSTISNWWEKASNIAEWSIVDAAVEEWTEAEKSLTRFPAAEVDTPGIAVTTAEAATRFDAEVIELAGMVQSGSIDEKLVLELMEHTGCGSRREFIKKHGVSTSEYDAAMKRLNRLAAKIVIKRKD